MKPHFFVFLSSYHIEVLFSGCGLPICFGFSVSKLEDIYSCMWPLFIQLCIDTPAVGHDFNSLMTLFFSHHHFIMADHLSSILAPALQLCLSLVCALLEKV